MRAVLLALMLPCATLAQNAAAPPDSPLQSSASATETTLVDDREATPARADNPASSALPEKILQPPPPEAAPTVSIRTDASGDVVEEYRRAGRIMMVRVRPPRGLPYTLIDTNGDGLLDRKDGDGPVRPVYWTIYEWN